MTKLAKDMTPEQREAALREIKRTPPPEPLPTDKRAADMTEAERREWLRSIGGGLSDVPRTDSRARRASGKLVNYMCALD